MAHSFSALMPSQFNIALIQPENYVFILALYDVARLLQCSFESLGAGCTVQVNTLAPDAVNVLLGYHLLANPEHMASLGSIIYQLEQVSDPNCMFDEHRLHVLKRARTVWDYSTDNIEFLRAKGLADIRHLPIGFHPRLQTIVKAREPDVDVLFYGTLNPRREKILRELDRHCRLKVLTGVFGPPRDAWIARSKIVLNLHYYETRIMEQARISYLLNNGCFMLSEDSAHSPFEGMIATASYENLVESCLDYLKDDTRRNETARQGFELFQKRPMVEYVQKVLARI